jgi:peptide-methionine (S)-S-oxide reductase
VIRTRVGYTGGTTSSPTYHNLGDHSEALQIDFDPSRVSYNELLDIFWDSHDAARESWSRQYRAAVFYHNEEQRRLAHETAARVASNTRDRIKTAIEPFSAFTLAEDYHQKHSLRFYPVILEELKAFYPNMKDYLGSTAVSRINGYLGGYGTCDSLQNEADSFGLSVEVMKKLIDVVCGHSTSLTCPVPK